MDNQEDIKLPERVMLLCQQYRTCCLNVETRKESERFRQELWQLCREILPRIADGGTKLWIALMDAYEVTRDEEMLQKVLDRVAEQAEELQPSAENLRLLAYCYYYVEDEGCADLVKAMFFKLRQSSPSPEVEKAMLVCQELVGLNV